MHESPRYKLESHNRFAHLRRAVPCEQRNCENPFMEEQGLAINNGPTLLFSMKGSCYNKDRKNLDLLPARKSNSQDLCYNGVVESTMQHTYNAMINLINVTYCACSIQRTTIERYLLAAG